VRKQVERLRQACRDADDALIGHLRPSRLRKNSVKPLGN
jgi:hypothetical protein